MLVLYRVYNDGEGYNTHKNMKIILDGLFALLLNYSCVYDLS